MFPVILTLDSVFQPFMVCAYSTGKIHALPLLAVTLGHLLDLSGYLNPHLASNNSWRGAVIR